jgi:ATP-binding cassette subfamily B protein
MKFPFTRQFDQMDCGPACIKMVAQYYGKEYPLSYLRTLSHLTREGVSIAGIRDALSQIGLDSASFEMSMSQLREKCPKPAILHWEQNHFVVLYDITWSRLQRRWIYHIANPAYGKSTVPEKEFTKAWLNGSKGVVIAIETTPVFFEKRPVKEKHSFIHFARKYVWPFKREMMILCFGFLLGTILSLVTPFLTQIMVDNGITQRNMNIVTSILLAQILLFIGSFSMELISSRVTLYLGSRISINILQDYLGKLLNLPISFFETKSVGDYNQRIGDHGRLQGFTTQATLNTAFSIISGSVLLVIIGYYSIFILVAYLALTGLSTIWMSYFWRKRKSLDYERFRVASKNQTKLFEMMSGIVDIKVNAYSKYKVKEWQDMQEELYCMNRKSLRWEQIQSTGYSLIGQLRNIFIIFWIATEVVHSKLTLGMMMSISNIIGQVNGPLSQLIGFLQSFQDAKISLERSEEVLLCPNEDSEELLEIPTDDALDIEFKDVTFCYTGRLGKPALQHINAVIPAGKMTAIVGESGSGKTTLMKLLLKFYEPTEGIITLGGTDIKCYKAYSIRENSGIVMQENFIFGDTIKQNIILGEPYNKEQMLRSMEMACLTDYIKGLPLGYNTRIGSDGIGVSGGEKQRIMIARSIYKHPLYMMLDEATSSLDAENERLITKNIEQEFKDRTLLVIAHRLSTVRNADNILVLRHGKIVESGKHSDLIAAHGYYYELVKNQLEIGTG